MKTFKFIIARALLICALVLIGSCDAKKLELTNPNELSPATYFKTASQVQSAVNAAYGNLQTRGLYNRHIWFGYDNMSHENCGNPQLEADKREYLDFSFDPTHGAIRAFWESCYIGINKANFVINNADVINEISDSQLSQAMKAKFNGEAKFMRALYYFMLVDRFGDVPLVLAVPDNQEGLPRSPKSDIWDQIEADLTDAANQCLDKSVEDAGRATSGAAWALLGKAHLFQKDYQAALDAFNKVNGGDYQYALEANYFDNFKEETEHGVEQIFSVEFNLDAGNSSSWNSDVTDVGLNETTFRGQEYGCFNWFNVFPSVDLTSEFETDADNGVKDHPRFDYKFIVDGEIYNGTDTASIAPLEQSDGTFYPRVGWNKYQNYYKQKVELNNASGINMKIIRYADVLLMMAECQANLNNLPAAVTLMNQVRNRADVAMPEYGTAEMDAIYPVSTLAEFMVALEHERKVELCGEQVRFPDLVRWGRLEAFMTEVKPSLPLKEQQDLVFKAPKNLLWPIPKPEIDANISLTYTDQNTGY
jgi:tetratricopeptide (TPR) repeat protein